MEIDAGATALGVGVREAANATWDAASIKYWDETQAGGKHHILFAVRDAAGNPLPGVKCVVDYPQDPADPHPRFEALSDLNGEANFAMYANLDITLKNGPYWAYLEDEAQSDRVTGMGLPEKHHVCFALTFVKTSGQTNPPLPGTVEQAARAAASQLTWMPINTAAALYKFAQANNLGYPQTDEFEFTVNTDGYLGQVFNLGIVYVKKGDWGNVKWTKKV